MTEIKQELEEREALWGKFLGKKASFLRALPNVYEAARTKTEHCFWSQKSEFGFAEQLISNRGIWKEGTI